MARYDEHVQEKLREVLAAYAPGIPARRTSALPTITQNTTNRWVMAIQNHKAQRAGKHHDLRLVDPDAGKAHSWAIPKSRMPAPGERLLAVQTHTHTPQYALHGKGEGVTLARKEPVSVLESSPDKLRFQLEDDAVSEFLLRRKSKDKWLLMNTTKTSAVLGQTHALRSLGLLEKDAAWGAAAMKGLGAAWNWGSKMLGRVGGGGASKSTALVPRTPGMPPMPGPAGPGLGQRFMSWAGASPVNAYAAQGGMGAGIGGVAGAASADPGNRMGGFMRGAVGGAALGLGGAHFGGKAGLNYAAGKGFNLNQTQGAVGAMGLGGLSAGGLAGGIAGGAGFGGAPPPPAPPMNPTNRSPWGGQQNAGGMSGTFPGKP